MKTQTPKLKIGDIVTKHSNGFRRKIRSIEMRGDKVCYSYYNEEIDENYRTTGEFNRFSIGFCSQDHLLNGWLKK